MKVLGVVGSPRKNGNTAKLVRKALEAARTVTGIETELYEMAGKKIHHCIGCFKCLDKGSCVFKDDFQDFLRRYLEADGVIIGTPVYHMSVTSLLKSAIDRLGNVIICSSLYQNVKAPQFSKVCGALAVGYSRFGGQELALDFLVNHFLLMNNVAVSGATLAGNYIGAPGFSGTPPTKPLPKGHWMKSKDAALSDERNIASAMELGKRVAEMTKIVRVGMVTLKSELPEEYFETLDLVTT